MPFHNHNGGQLRSAQREERADNISYIDGLDSNACQAMATDKLAEAYTWSMGSDARDVAIGEATAWALIGLLKARQEDATPLDDGNGEATQTPHFADESGIIVDISEV